MHILQIMTSRELSRIFITGNITEFTPICVLLEIADAHGIYYDQKDNTHQNFSRNLIKIINETPVPSINENKSSIDWGYLARFINKNSKWPQSKLIDAYNFLIKFITTEDPLKYVPLDFSIGLQTPTTPNSINACVLYKICTYHMLNLNKHTTIEQMRSAVIMLRSNPDTLYKRAISFLENNASKKDLINILLMSPTSFDVEETQYSNIDYNKTPIVTSSHEMFSLIHKSLHTISDLQTKINPVTISGSIALAAVIYRIDISKSANPIDEYKILKLTGRNSYVPSDPWMNYWSKRTSNLFDLLVSFNPIFPECYYNPTTLNSMAMLECYSAEELNNSSSYELMQLAFVTETFYMGELPNLTSRQTLINLDDIDEVPYGELFCYGSLDNTVTAITVEELTHMFNINRNFTNPFKQDSVFTDRSISKLKKLLQSKIGPVNNLSLQTQRHISYDTANARKKLVELITSLEILTKSNDLSTRNLVSLYNDSSCDIKKSIVDMLTKLLHIGMYMRGWMGNGYDYPVTRAPVPSEREAEVAINITQSISSFESSCESLGIIGKQILDLPLVKYRDGQYHLSNNINDGLTISERLNIVKQGDTTKNMASCVRLSSNWICSTAHKYLLAVGQPSPFDIFHLRNIS